MNNSKFIIFFMGLFLCSCSLTKEKTLSFLDTRIVRFHYEDKNGNFKITRQSGQEKKTDRIVTKQQLEILDGDKDKILEQAIVISNPGSIKNKNAVLRPEEGQYSVWFEGKKYSSSIKINSKTRTFDLKTSGPNSKDNSNKSIVFPDNKNILCFFSQLTECLNFHGFIKKSIKNETGAIRLNIVWNGYPFFQEAYNDLPMELFSDAKIAFDGKMSDDEFRFSLGVAGQMIFIITNSEGDLKKMFWIAQGISMVREDLKEK